MASGNRGLFASPETLAQDDRAGNRLLTVVALATFAFYGATVTAIGPLIPSIAGTFGLSLGEAGSLFAVGGVGFVLVVFLGGYVADALGKRDVLIVGLITLAIGVFGLGLAPSFQLLLVAAFVQNVGSGLLESAIGGLVVDLNPRRSTAALNILHSFFGWGALLGPLLVGLLLIPAGWRWVCILIALPFVPLAVFASRQRFPAPSATEPVKWSELRTLLRDRVIQVSTVGILLYVASELSLSAWTFPYLHTVRGYSEIIAGGGVSIFWVGIAGGRWASAWFSRLLRPAQIVQAGAAIFAVGTVGLLFTTDAPLALFALLVAGLGAAAIYPTIMAHACARNPALSGTITGLITTATGVGILAGPTAIGWLGDALGLRGALFAVVVLILAVLALYQTQHHHAGEGRTTAH